MKLDKKKYYCGEYEKTPSKKVLTCPLFQTLRFMNSESKDLSPEFRICTAFIRLK